MLKNGDVIRTAFDEYVVGRQIGQGGAGAVFEAHDSSKTPVAIKVLKETSKTKLKRFRNEVNVGRSIKHKHVVSVLDHGVCETKLGPLPFLAMPLYGGSLRDQMKAGTVSPHIALKQVLEIASGLEALHLFGCWHRDVKPENILVDSVGGHLLLTDLGIAHVSPELEATSVETKPGDRLANFQYAAPEQRSSTGVVDRRSDLYALGLIWNELVTGLAPQGTGFRRIQDVSVTDDWMDEVVAKLLQQQPSGRHANVADLRADIEIRTQLAVVRQRIDDMTGRVVELNGIRDAIYEKPVAIVDVDVQGIDVVCHLNHRVSDEWQQVFFNGINSWSSFVSPRSISFSGSIATIRAHDRHTDALNYFQGWLPKAAEQWKARCEAIQQQDLALRRKEHETAIADEKKRVTLLAALKRNLA
jgi:serine/threonine protein kinase